MLSRTGWHRWLCPCDILVILDDEHWEEKGGPMTGSRISEHKVILEKNLPATMRDGTVLYADVLRPDAPGQSYDAHSRSGWR